VTEQHDDEKAARERELAATLLERERELAAECVAELEAGDLPPAVVIGKALAKYRAEMDADHIRNLKRALRGTP